jgi:hypothetical protein
LIDTAQLRDIALAIPGVTETSQRGQLAFAVADRGIAWSFMERVHPKKPRVPNADILAVRCPIERKEMLIEAAPAIYFDDDHYRGFPAVLVRLAAIDRAELAALLESAALSPSPKARRAGRAKL